MTDTSAANGDAAPPKAPTKRTPRVEVNQGQAQIKFAEKPATIDVFSDTGMKLTLGEPGPLDELHLTEALPGDLSLNRGYLFQVYPLLFLRAIDDDPVIQPRNKREIEALFTRLGRIGQRTLMQGWADNFASDPAEEKAAIKNS